MPSCHSHCVTGRKPRLTRSPLAIQRASQAPLLRLRHLSPGASLIIGFIPLLLPVRAGRGRHRKSITPVEESLHCWKIPAIPEQGVLGWKLRVLIKCRDGDTTIFLRQPKPPDQLVIGEEVRGHYAFSTSSNFPSFCFATKGCLSPHFGQ